MSVSRHHADWLSLVETSGPFLSLPVLLRAFPQGLDPRDPEQAKQLRLAYEEWQEKPNLAAKQRAWVMHVLTQVLLHPKELLAEGQILPPGLMATMAEYGEILRPELALLGPTGSELAGKPQLLISLYPVEQSLDKPVTGEHWKATPGTRMMELLHATDVPLGLVTNGEKWMLVFAPRGDTTGFTSWYASLWIDEPITLRAFHSLLSTRRFFGVAPSDTLLALLKESAQDQQEVTNQLGDQVRDAVEVLIQAFDRLDQDSGRTLLKGLDEKSLYDAALTVMMRLVFLFSAEERGLLHLNEPLYDDNYAVSTLREQLQEVADHYGEEVLERRHDGWARLLASFRAVHGGVNHQDLMLPAYGGSLFDPDRYPLLEGRAQGTGWQSDPAAPLEINNRVVLHLLKSLQMLQVKVPGGGPAEALRVSFEGLNIEQIGHVYEGLLDHTAVRAKEVVLGLAASRKKPVASMTLAELEKLRQDDEEKLIELLEEETGRSGKALEKALKNGGEPDDFQKLLVACGQDKELAERIISFRGLLRQDSFERLVVVLPGGIYVSQGSARRSTGTHYTPRSLTEPIVQHTLEPLVYRGPSEGRTKEQWHLRSAKEILDLKVCDMAMGSGAFLVQACRYLSERLVEAWENLEKEHPGEVLITPEGGFSLGEPSERLIPKEAAERLATARRLVADRCLYGVDINPMAVEMAKLSIWLITVDKNRPFTFLDHALKCGDSLLGVGSFQQIEVFSLRPGEWQVTFATANLFRYVEQASAKRLALEDLPSNDATQIETKNRLHAEAETAIAKVKALADCLLALELRGLDGDAYDSAREVEAEKIQLLLKQDADNTDTPLLALRCSALAQYAAEQLSGCRTFQWPAEFPEVFARGGFDSFIGNPPFMGGSKITISTSPEYRELLVKVIAFGERGKADLCAYFLLRAKDLLSSNGYFGLVATNSISQGDTRRIAMERIAERDSAIYRAETNKQWPGAAGVTVSLVWASKGSWNGNFTLDSKPCGRITSFLTQDAIASSPLTLASQEGKAFRGTEPKGLGFVLEFHEAEDLVLDDPRNAEIILPYLTGQDLYSRPDQSSSRKIIDFSEWPLEKAQGYPGPFERVKRLVKPYRDTITKQIHEPDYWKFWDKRLDKYEMISSLARVLARSYCGNMHALAFLPLGIVYDTSVVVFGISSYEGFAVLQSSLHEIWARFFGPAAMRTDMRYATKLCFETFPFPQNVSFVGEQPAGALGVTARSYYETRASLMVLREEGLTQTYNRLHDPGEKSEDVVLLRTLHLNLDQAVAAAYDWGDLDLGHGFHQTKQGVRYTLSETARRTVLDRLLALNHQRYNQEVAAGLHEKKANTAPAKRTVRKNKMIDAATQGRLY